MTCEDSNKIDLRFLLKEGYLKKGSVTAMSLSWSINGRPNGSITLICSMHKKWIRLIFRTINNTTNEKTDYDYKIHLTSVPSNLGKGEVLYFICPSTGRRCRVLYSAYGESCFFSRSHYERKGLRLLYNSQCQSKKDYANSRYHAIDRQLQKYHASRVKQIRSSYKGLVTKEYLRINKLEWKQLKFNEERIKKLCGWLRGKRK